MKPKSSLPHSQVPTTCPYPTKVSVHHRIHKCPLPVPILPKYQFITAFTSAHYPSLSYQSISSLPHSQVPTTCPYPTKVSVHHPIHKCPLPVPILTKYQFITTLTSAHYLSLSYQSISSLPHSQVPTTCPYPTKVSVQVRVFVCEHFVTRCVLTGRSC